MPNYTSKTAAQGSVLFWLSQEVWRIRARERLIRVPVRLTRSTALVREPRSYWGSRRCRLAAENVGQGRIGGGKGTDIQRSLRKSIPVSACRSSYGARSPAPTSSRTQTAPSDESAATSNAGRTLQWRCAGPPPPCSRPPRAFRRLKAHKQLTSLRRALAAHQDRNTISHNLEQQAVAA